LNVIGIAVQQGTQIRTEPLSVLFAFLGIFQKNTIFAELFSERDK
jgi:hypothetical protein